MQPFLSIPTVAICIVSILANPTPKHGLIKETSTLKERADPPAEPAGSVLASPAEPPTYSPEPRPQMRDGKFQWQIFKSCPDNQRNRVSEAWADSKELSDALASYKFKSDYQPAMDMYMGDRSTFTDYRFDPPWDFPYQISSTSAPIHGALFYSSRDRSVFSKLQHRLLRHDGRHYQAAPRPI